MLFRSEGVVHMVEPAMVQRLDSFSIQPSVAVSSTLICPFVMAMRSLYCILLTGTDVFLST